MCLNTLDTSCFAVAVYLCCQYTPGARDQGAALLLCVAVTNADYKTPPSKCAQKIGKSSKNTCGVGVVVIKYETKNDFLYSKQLSGVFQHRLRSPRTYSEGWSISRGRSDSYHLNGSARCLRPLYFYLISAAG